jgi:leucyl aminopeptidase
MAVAACRCRLIAHRQVRARIANVDMDEVFNRLTTFSTFFTRYYRSTTGVESANWLYNVVLEYARGNANVSVTQWTHPGYECGLVHRSGGTEKAADGTVYSQRSLIARFPGQNPALPTVVIGAHQDSINGGNPSGGRSPGADDDGSGSVTILEAFRVLVTGGFDPVHPVEFQWVSVMRCLAFPQASARPCSTPPRRSACWEARTSRLPIARRASKSMACSTWT